MKNKNIEAAALKRFIYLTTNAAYNFDRKEEYRKLGRTILRSLAQKMGLNKGEFDIRWNPGGIACSGDHTFHTDNVYLALHDNLGLGWFYYRSCNGRNDYCGKSNQIVYWKKLETAGLDSLAKALKIMHQKGYTDEHGDFVMTPAMVEHVAMMNFK